MTTSASLFRVLSFSVLVGVSQAELSAASRPSDLVHGKVRASSVAVAQQLSKTAPVQSTGSGLVNPFNPPGFEQPAAREGAPGTGSPETFLPVAIAPLSDEEILKNLVRQLPAAGRMTLNGDMLTLGAKSKRTGEVFTVPFDGNNYEVEIVAISARTYTLRYRTAEVTRPIAK